jgi:predicted NBD/HSP70 family sugar kinase
MREHNSGLLLNLLFRQQGQSRADLSRITGLSRSTVSAIVDDLIDGNLVREVGAGDSRGGRRPTLLEFNDDANALVGVEMGASHVAVFVTNLRAKVRTHKERKHPVVTEPASTMKLIEELIDEALAEARLRPRELLGIGVAVPCPLDLRNPEHLCPQLMPAWDGIAVTGTLARRYGCAVAMDNDANLGALAEAAFGAGQDATDLIYLKVASGIGAGLLLNGRLYRGTGGLAGELGHFLVDPNGLVCRCGNRGCLETLAATGALVELLGRSHGDDMTVQRMLDLARAGDVGCRRVIADAGRAIGRAISMLINMLNPELVVVGGDLAAAGDLLLDGVRDSIARAALPSAAEAAEVVTGVLGERAQVLGAIALVISEADRAFPTRLAAGAA